MGSRESSKDGGIDILAYTDPLGARPPRIKVQVKRTEQKVCTDSLCAFISLIGNDDVGLFVSTGGFTRDAETLARMQETRKIRKVETGRVCLPTSYSTMGACSYRA